MGKPYVISAELERYPQVDQTQIAEFRASLTADLEQLGKTVEWVGTDELSAGLSQLVANSPVPVISLETKYIRPNLLADQIAISRAVDEAMVSTGYDSRSERLTLEQQLDGIGRRWRGQEVALADDIVFSGAMASWLAAELQARSVSVKRMLAGIAIGEGVQRLATAGVQVEAVRTYEEVDDQICERDLAIVPGSGRKVIGRAATALYFDSRYGRPDEWASIPQVRSTQFCANSLRRAASLLLSDVDMSELGDFVGYASTGSAQQAILSRLAQEELAYESV